MDTKRYCIVRMLYWIYHDWGNYFLIIINVIFSNNFDFITYVVYQTFMRYTKKKCPYVATKIN